MIALLLMLIYEYTSDAILNTTINITKSFIIASLYYLTINVEYTYIILHYYTTIPFYLYINEPNNSINKQQQQQQQDNSKVRNKKPPK